MRFKCTPGSFPANPVPGSSTSKRRTKPGTQTLQIWVDGAARGNPGPSGVGAVGLDGSGKKLFEVSAYIGETTNNVAEYCALICALQQAQRLGRTQASVFTDSQLLARQVNGEYKVKDKQLQWLSALVQNLLEGFHNFRIQSIPRVLPLK